MSAGLARYLKDFSAPPPAAQEVFELPPADIAFDFEPEPQVDLEALHREAYEQGRADMMAEMQDVHRRELDALMAAHSQAAAEMASAFERKMADELAQTLPRLTSEIKEILSAHVMSALRPILDEAITERAMHSLAETVRSVFVGDGGIELTLKGPEALADRLKTQLAGEDIDFRHVEAPGFDLAVEHGDTVLMTRLSAWRESVEELLK